MSSIQIRSQVLPKDQWPSDHQVIMYSSLVCCWRETSSFTVQTGFSELLSPALTRVPLRLIAAAHQRLPFIHSSLLWVWGTLQHYLKNTGSWHEMEHEIKCTRFSSTKSQLYTLVLAHIHVKSNLNSEIECNLENNTISIHSSYMVQHFEQLFLRK